MNIESQDFLRLAEQAHTIAFVDIEATGLRGDYNSVMVVSVKPFGKRAESFTVKQPGDDAKLVIEAKEALEEYDAWVTYYGKGFDIPMLNTRLLVHGHLPIAKRHHIDMYYTLKSNILTARRSQGHLLGLLQTPEQKMGVSAEVWNRVLADPQKELPTMIKRCESDVKGLEALYRRTRHLITEIKR